MKPPDVSADDEIEYRFVKGKGWVAGYPSSSNITRNEDGTYNITFTLTGDIRYYTLEGTINV